MGKSPKIRISGVEIPFIICPGAPQTRSEVLGMRFSMSLETFMDYIIQFFPPDSRDRLGNFQQSWVGVIICPIIGHTREINGKISPYYTQLERKIFDHEKKIGKKFFRRKL